MSTLSLSPHLDARYGKTVTEILFSNLCYGTRILAQEDSWDKLDQVRSGQAGLEDPWVKRALGACVLTSDQEKADYPDFVLRLDAALKGFVDRCTGHRPETPLSKEGLLALLDMAEPLYRERHMPKPLVNPQIRVDVFLKAPHRLVDFIFDHTRAFLTYDLEPATEPLNLGLVRQFFDRPAMKHRYEQQFCIPLTTQQRARLIIETMKPGSRVLVLGDDDLVALALVEMTDQLHVDVLELDEDLVAFLHEKGKGRFKVLECNLRYGVPEEMKKAYDCVTTDPPYAGDGMRFFLECARDSLADGPDSRLFLTTYPGLLEEPDRLYSDIEDLGLSIHKTRKHFSRYIYNNMYRVQQLTALRHLGSPLSPTSELIGFPFLYAHFFEVAHAVGAKKAPGEAKQAEGAKSKAKVKKPAAKKAKAPRAKPAKA